MNNNSVEQPDPDNIKMFVGQVPHDMDENDLRKLFEEFGRVHQINILRDKITGSHRGKRIHQIFSKRDSFKLIFSRGRLTKRLLPSPSKDKLYFWEQNDDYKYRTPTKKLGNTDAFKEEKGKRGRNLCIESRLRRVGQKASLI